MSNIEDLEIALKESDLKLAEEVLAKIQSGGCGLAREFPNQLVACKKLFATYQIRNSGLAARTSAHARQLHESVNELLVNLEKHVHKSCLINEVVGEEEHRYIVFFEPEEKMVLGLLKTYSQLDVSKERWHEIWAAP